MKPIIREYFAALERLRQGKTILVEKGSGISKDTVALEAGRKRGSIRNRPGFEKLIEEIDLANLGPKKLKRKRTEKNPKQTEQINTLKRDLDVARSRYMSLLYLNAQMAQQIRKLGGDVPRYSGVLDITIDPESTDVPY